MTLERLLEISTRLPSQDIPGLLSCVARGEKQTADLSIEAAYALFAEWLSGALSPLAQGALWTAYRFKGESIDELRGFVRATEETMVRLSAPSGVRPVVFSSYNGARRHANLLPLLAILLAQLGVPVLIHGAYGGVADDSDIELPQHDPRARVTTGEILAHLGFLPADCRGDIPKQLERDRLCYVPLDVLHPPLANILSLRRQLGVRSSVHTVVKLFNPFHDTAVQCAGVTHPPYLARMRGFFLRSKGCALVLRGTEGEPVAHAKRRPALIGFDDGHEHEYFPEDRTPLTQIPTLPSDRTVAKTCSFIGQVLAGLVSIPAPLHDQLICLLTLSGFCADKEHACHVIRDSLKPIRRYL